MARLTARPEPWRRVRAAGPLEVAARCAGARAGPCVSAVREWRSKTCAVYNNYDIFSYLSFFKLKCKS